MPVTKIQKRHCRIVKFDPDKIKNAVCKGLESVGKDVKIADSVCKQVVEIVNRTFVRKIPTVEDVQDIVENVLIKNKLSQVAKSYILYREKRAEARTSKRFFGVEDELNLSVNATVVLEKRYLRKDMKGNIIETPKQMFRRVAKAVAKGGAKHNGKFEKMEEDFFGIMSRLEFLPNSPTLMNAGTDIGQLSACFVLPIEDSLVSIFETLKLSAIIHQSGGGTGYSFSHIRPKGDIVKSTKGVASGPVSFMKIYDTATDVIKQGGRRRGANMGILNIDHPDIIEFIKAKQKEGVLTNFNLSVAVTDNFMAAVSSGKRFSLVHPNGNVVEKVKAQDLFEIIVYSAWLTGDPGIVFIDEINRKNFLSEMIESTNPCGEQPLLAYESCNLGSINLVKMVKDGKIDWDKLKRTVELGVCFLDNVIDVNKYPDKKIEAKTKENRKIGLGVMGFAEMLIKIGVRYDSDLCLKVASKLMKFITETARKKSVELGRDKGSFPAFKGSKLYGKYKHMRNATVTTIAPTGTLSIIAGCSSGIEPLFAVCFIRHVLEGNDLIEINPVFEEMVDLDGDVMMKIAHKGSVQSVKEVPVGLRRLFVTALDIKPEWHVKVQAAFQKYTDNAVSKTINLDARASVSDVKNAFLLAYKLKCKGITVYRYGSKKEQVLQIGPVKGKGETLEYVSADSEFSGGCPEPACPD